MDDHPLSTVEYLSAEETNQRRELAWGVLREPPAPFYSHQRIVLGIARALQDHAEPRGLGRVAMAPLDVILDEKKALIVQPDVLFVSAERLAIIRNQVWGAPDLVVEVLSDGTAAHDRGAKLEWYRQYGVRECWLVEPFEQRVIVVDFTGGGPEQLVVRGENTIPTSVLPALQLAVAGIFT